MRDPAVAIVLAAGLGERLGEPSPKAFVPVGGRPMLVHAVQAALGCDRIGSVVVTVPAGREDLTRAMLQPLGSHAVVPGGASRQASVRAALATVPADLPLVVCHDAARCLASPALFGAVLEALDGPGHPDGAVPVVPVPDTVKRVRGGMVAGTVDRSELWLAQTPQAFRAAALREAHARAEHEGVEATDDAMLLERAGYRVVSVPGEPGNLKITTPQDLVVAERMLEEVRSHG
ncbi:MAG: 2-C-methyl-D-erythritol 4-phosphate cytidylyltransferase [Candidatus Velamenicoccus archaeovorus]